MCHYTVFKFIEYKTPRVNSIVNNIVSRYHFNIILWLVTNKTWKLDVRCWVLEMDVGCWVLGDGCWVLMLAVGYEYVFVALGRECKGHPCIFHSVVLWTYNFLKISSTLEILKYMDNGNKSEIKTKFEITFFWLTCL